MSFPPSRAHSPSPRGRGASPRPPPSYARSSLDRPSPSMGSRSLEEEMRPRVPPPIYLRRSGIQALSSKGALRIHVPAWACVLIRPPRLLDLHPLDSRERTPPCGDTVLSGALEVVVTERQKVRAISVGVQSVARLHMGHGRGWEEDGIFERGVEVLGGNDDGIWLEKGSQSFGFSIILPATLATTDMHNYGRVSYIITACAQGLPSSSSSFSSLFKSTSHLDPEIPFVNDFERVIARSDKVDAKVRSRSGSQSASSRERSMSRTGSGSGPFGSKRSSSGDTAEASDALGLERISLGYSSGEGEDESTVIAVGTKTPCTGGLYTRRQSASDPAYLPTAPTSDINSSASSLDRANVKSPRSPPSLVPSEKTAWMKGDLVASRSLCVHAISPMTGGVVPLNIRKEAFGDGLGTCRFKAVADVFSISSVFLLSYQVPAPSPRATIFLFRLILAQSYSVVSPRTPNDPPIVPETPKQHVLYQIGRVHKSTESHPGTGVDCLWRGKEVPKKGKEKEDAEREDAWSVKAVVRVPNHDKIRPTTNEGTITPIRVSHELIFQVYYSVHGEDVKGEAIKGAGELRMMRTKIPIKVPSCHCLSDSLSLPPYSTLADTSSDPTSRSPYVPSSPLSRSPSTGPSSSSPPAGLSAQEIDSIISSPDVKRFCMCGSTFAELGESMLRVMRAEDENEEDQNERDVDQARSRRRNKVGERVEEADRSL
ncbi:hypothetical protein IAR50_004488 [Cryptococcus sp. DSM 104548]